MSNTISAEALVVQKTKELCQLLLDHPDFRQIRSKVETFMADEGAKSQYRQVLERGDELTQRQQNGLSISQDEILTFEEQRQAVLQNRTTLDFLDAREEIQKVHDVINRYVGKTFELGRLPGPDDFDSGGCGGNCSCKE